MDFKLVSSYSPYGDQINAIDRLTSNLKLGVKEQTLLGATGTGKTFTIANVIKNINKPTLILAHNKTLAGQLYAELKKFFPENHVEYFISYYDYYQPEAYVPSKDMYIEKDASINDEIDQMRHAATQSILEYKDTIIVASVSCIYGIGDPDDYSEYMLVIRTGNDLGYHELLERLVKLQFTRSDYEFKRGTFRIKGDNVDIYPANSENNAIRVSFFDDEIEDIKIFDSVTGKVIKKQDIVTIYPATHFMVSDEKRDEAIRRIEEELKSQINYFHSKGLLLEEERITQRTKYDLEMIKEIGTCQGIENYSRHMALREAGETPSVLLDFFKKDFLLVVDESHVTLPQVRGMYNGDRSRKETLVEYGFRLPSALDNRPLTFKEFEDHIDQVIYVSATPGEYEMERSDEIVEQIIRPTGLLDPIVKVESTKNQIDKVLELIKNRISKNERTLITTLTIKMSEDLCDYLKSIGIKVAYLHSEIKALERLEIIRKLRMGVYDVLVGINLLREGLDIPEVSLICIMDADKEGFLRSERSLIQTIGRAARNANGEVYLFADNMTDSMKNAIEETNRRRNIQDDYNKVHNIIPKTIIKPIDEAIGIEKEEINSTVDELSDIDVKNLSTVEKHKLLDKLEKDMKQAAKELKFEEAMTLRDLIISIKSGN